MSLSTTSSFANDGCRRGPTTFAPTNRSGSASRNSWAATACTCWLRAAGSSYSRINPTSQNRHVMWITIDSRVTNARAWIEALRRASNGDEVRVFEPSAVSRVLGSAGVDFAIRGADVFHASALTPHAARRAKLTATLEDLSCWLMPERHTPAEIKAARQFAENILDPAHGVIAVSEAARQDAIRLLDLHPGKITVIYPGVDAAFFDAQPAPRERPYVLY